MQAGAVVSFVCMENLISKYNVPGPRYTSYPTVPHWDDSTYNEASWKESLSGTFRESNGEVSLYIHLPFCESLCTYCGCTTRITKNHGVESKYIRYVLKEWALYKATFPSPPVIREIHLGGGTPTFFTPENLEVLIHGLLDGAVLPVGYEFGFEGHPGNTTEEHLRVLSQLGFTRVSFGIQDFDPEVQLIINRKQDYGQVERVTQLARAHGFTSINYDLIYGLPKQTESTIRKTIAQTIKLAPGRIAYYGYAHVPWIKRAQRSFQAYLPDADQKAAMYQLGKQLLVDAGYKDMGMDHFALPTDSLYRAFEQGRLHRNFMGYTTQASRLLIGLGMSAISDSWTAFSQNHKTLPQYYTSLDQDIFPSFRGHLLTQEDLLVRQHILHLMCQFETSWGQEEWMEMRENYHTRLLDQLASDQLIAWGQDGIRVLDAGKPFIRNVCMALDARLWKDQQAARFSQTV